MQLESECDSIKLLYFARNGLDLWM